ncbi:hypothetical protein [Streptomyces sp. Ncost-T10-10d]|uniref:hypothetical protein n=1 Tax=Streptomyces sp. Ncost-T10-10d TaxID=1839774 RepID=UPI00114CF03D|nr:hypothetical protein [Streptomyces sp. Ncost-T10-10d]
MHGAPASAAEGCHDAMTVTAAAPAQATAGHAAMRAGHGSAQATAAMPAMNGESCVFTHARDRVLPLLMSLGLALVTVQTLAGRLAAVRGPARRGPPLTGRGLLLQVCIART